MDSANKIAAGPTPVKDLRDWILRAEEIGQLTKIKRADWNLEIGAITEMICLQSKHPKSLLFDEIKGYPAGWQVVSNVFANQKLAAMTLGLPVDLGARDFVMA